MFEARQSLGLRRRCVHGGMTTRGASAAVTTAYANMTTSSCDHHAAASSLLPSTTSATRHASGARSRGPTATCCERGESSRACQFQESTTGCSTSRRHDSRAPSALSTVGLVAVAVTTLSLLAPPLGLCSESLSGSSLTALQSFLAYVESLGAAGPWVFVMTVMAFEMVPLFPTQPLSIASGLLFGPVKGTLIVMLGGTLAATNAFLISRGVGRKLAEKVIVMEMSEDHGAVASKLAKVQHAIRSGGFWQQLTAVILLRLTPVVPFSASNYVLGLTPVLMSAYVGGTAIGISVWSLLYASLGGASRQLLDGGMDVGTLFADLAERAGKYSSTALGISLGLGIAAGAVYGVQQLVKQSATTPDIVGGGTEEGRMAIREDESAVLEREATVRK